MLFRSSGMALGVGWPGRFNEHWWIPTPIGFYRDVQQPALRACIACVFGLSCDESSQGGMWRVLRSYSGPNMMGGVDMLFGLMIAGVMGSTAQAAPMTLTYQLRVADDVGQPVQGETSVQISLWTDATSEASTDVLWTTVLTPDLQDGFATLYLSDNGSGEVIQDYWFGRDVWVDVEVGGSDLGARMPIGEVPRAATVRSAVGQTWAHPGADYVLNEFPTEIAVTSERSTGNYSFNGVDGRAGTTERCQALMGEGARLCRSSDVERFTAAGAINRFGESNPDKITIPAPANSYYWISSGASTDLYQNTSGSSTHLYGDCYNFETGSSGTRGMIYGRPDSSYNSGVTFTSTCNNSYQLLCCR